MYNFRTQTCMELELLANEYFHNNNLDIKVCADFLETGGFFSTITCLLQHKKPNASEVLEYLQSNNHLLGLRGSQISDEEAQAVYKQFEQLFGAN